MEHKKEQCQRDNALFVSSLSLFLAAFAISPLGCTYKCRKQCPFLQIKSLSLCPAHDSLFAHLCLLDNLNKLLCITSIWKTSTNYEIMPPGNNIT